MWLADRLRFRKSFPGGRRVSLSLIFVFENGKAESNNLTLRRTWVLIVLVASVLYSWEGTGVVQNALLRSWGVAREDFVKGMTASAYRECFWPNGRTAMDEARGLFAHDRTERGENMMFHFLLR